jgi:hypothetical protein
VLAAVLKTLLWPLFVRSALAEAVPVMAAQHVMSLIWPLFASVAWALTATLLAGTTSEGAMLASVLVVGVGSTRNCGGEHNR